MNVVQLAPVFEKLLSLKFSGTGDPEHGDNVGLDQDSGANQDIDEGMESDEGEGMEIDEEEEGFRPEPKMSVVGIKLLQSNRSIYSSRTMSGLLELMSKKLAWGEMPSQLRHDTQANLQTLMD
ncbi:uncharacterized protein LACBIDRAFT_334103 [Laccaria bicolor S238N-H82]|uniref:Predicted protein n=1 Tax=Laccaria bicolor (strain S238N-H82 / ATCC MYA-4686) TaxID=486041 RepID=B0DY35_LACBS|nr:uncharacterized protein LACBIDRAFT_334103 [Laccaria bicolor S238N-H82]EDR00495.1 predicted protein [Laccaria bicolor S238N-H82]|eukprot:XP_001888887.1 predicted protein [Laccaria bicolor S238N-H82]